MVLGSASGTSSHASVGSSVDGLSKNAVLEDGIVGDNSSGQVVGHALADIKNSLKLSVGIFGNNLEGSEKLSRQQHSLLFALEVLEWNIDASGLPSSIAVRDSVVLERVTTEDNFSAIELKDSIHMLLDLGVVPGEDGSNGQVLKGAFSSLVLHLLEKTSLTPVSVHEHDRLG